MKKSRKYRYGAIATWTVILAIIMILSTSINSIYSQNSEYRVMAAEEGNENNFEPLGSNGTNPPIVTGVSSSRIVLDWDDVPGASGYNVYYAPEPRYLDDDNNRKTDATGITESTHTITSLSPWTNVFIRVEVLGTEAEDIYDHAKTLGGPRAELESAVREVHMAAPDIIEIVFADFRTVHDGSSLIGNDGAAWKSATWTITRLDGNPINVQTKYRKSIPVAQPDWGYNTETWGDKDNDVVDLDHHIYLKLDQDVLSNPDPADPNADTAEILNIKTTDGPTGTLEFNMVFSDNYLEGPLDVNQIAYNPMATERYAYVHEWMGDGGPVPVTSYQNYPASVLYEPANILDDRDVVLSGISVVKRSPERLDADGKDEASGTDVGSIDISSLGAQDNLTYRVKIPGVGVSWPTQVSNLGFLKAFYVTLRGFDANGWYRSIEEAYWGPYTRPIDEYSDCGTRSHGWAYIPPPDLELHDWRSDFDFDVMIDGNGDPKGTKIPVRGGFHDAGDFDIRPSHTMIPIILYAVYELNSNAFTDGQLDIEESGNGIPDLLDLALWGSKAFEDIQRSDGGVSMGVQTDGHPQQYFYANNDILKSHHPGYPGLKPHWTYAPSAAISAIAAGFFAKGAYLVEPFDATRASELETKAIDAYNYAKNNGASTHTKIYGAGELWRLTGDSQYKDDFESFWDAGAWNYESSSYDKYRSTSNYVAGDVALPQFVDAYVSMSGARSDIIDAFKADLITVSDERVADTDNRHGHRNNRPITHVGYGQGYGLGRWSEATISLLKFDDLSASDRQGYINMLSLNADFLLGTNPLSHVPMSGLGTINPMEPLWHDGLAFNKQFDLPIIPGYSVFGPFDDFTADSYYAEAGAGFYPDHNDFPLMNNYADVRTWVRTSEGTSHYTQTSHALFYCALLGEGLVVPDSWKPGGSNFLSGIPGTGGGSPPPPPPPPQIIDLIPAGDDWRYSEVDPQPVTSPSWNEPGFDDSGWLIGPAPLGYGDSTTYGTVLNDNDGSYYFRNAFTLEPDTELIEATLKVASDNYAQVYLNGAMIDDDSGANHEFDYWNRNVDVPISAFQTGVNTIAVFVYNSAGSSDAYMDLELEATVTLEEGENQPPTITTSDITTAVEGQLYSNIYTATDPENDELTWSLDTDAPWLSIDPSTGELSGTPSDGDAGIYWVNVTVSDPNGSSDSHYFILVVHDAIILNQGWNLISIPRIQISQDISNILENIDGSYDAVRWYDNSNPNEPWRNYKKGKPFGNDLTGLNETLGFWIHITQPGNLSFRYNGTLPESSRKIVLHKGWNLVGFPSYGSKVVTDGLNNLNFGTDVDTILYYDSESQKWKQVGETDILETGRGYWMHSTVDATWNVPIL